jgi:preprotein translocase subunit Sec61beta
MPAKKSDSGLMSSAGLMRYFESEETNILIDPKTVVALSVGVGIALLGLNAYFGLWP